MTQDLSLRFKIASEPAEFEQIRHLNYRAFVEEIPQHEPNSGRVLVDRFDADNTYAICLREDVLVGMLSVCGRRPFSLDHKLKNLDSYLPAGRSICEIRLLAVKPEHRSGIIFRGLVRFVARYCLGEGYDLAVISGTERQLELYRRMGFTPFGPLVGTSEARFQPMYLTLEAFRQHGKVFVQQSEGVPASYLPGPVEIDPEVWEAMQRPPVSHRGEVFVSELRAVRRELSAMTGATHVQLLLGSGTLANDMVAAQISLLGMRGLVLSNGEFGERLVNHASRWNLSFSCLRQDWGSSFERRTIEAALNDDPAIGWLWAVHCETSTGALNDLSMLRDICNVRGIDLSMDCVSSLGTIPVDLQGVRFATGVSGKGVGSLAGIALVFHDREVRPVSRLPRYLDLGLYATATGSPFTHSSNLLRALHAAVRRFPRQVRTIANDAFWLRAELRALGFEILLEGDSASPAVTTLVLPPEVSSDEVGRTLEQEGYLISYRSEYLRARNWIQICLMGCYRRDRLEPLTRALSRVSSVEVEDGNRLHSGAVTARPVPGRRI